MKPNFIGFIVFMAIISFLVGSVPVGEDMMQNTTLMDEEEEPYVNYLLSYTEAWEENPWGTLVSVGAHTKFFRALFNVLLQTKTREALFAGPWGVIWTVIWVPVIAIVIVAVVLVFIGIIQKTISGG